MNKNEMMTKFEELKKLYYPLEGSLMNIKNLPYEELPTIVNQLKDNLEKIELVIDELMPLLSPENNDAEQLFGQELFKGNYADRNYKNISLNAFCAEISAIKSAQIKLSSVLNDNQNAGFDEAYQAYRKQLQRVLTCLQNQTQEYFTVNESGEVTKSRIERK